MNYSTTVKCLGVIFDSNLTFDTHIRKICQTSFQFIRFLYRIRQFINESTAKMIVASFVNSRLDYCNSVLSACTLQRKQRLQRIMNCCARLIKRLPRRSSTSHALRQLHWLHVRNRITFKLCCLVHRCLYGQAPNYLKKLLRPAHSSDIAICSFSSSSSLPHSSYCCS